MFLLGTVLDAMFSSFPSPLLHLSSSPPSSFNLFNKYLLGIVSDAGPTLAKKTHVVFVFAKIIISFSLSTIASADLAKYLVPDTVNINYRICPNRDLPVQG